MMNTISTVKFQVNADMVRTLCMALCVVMVLSFVMVCNTQVAFCDEVDPSTALTEVGNTIATVIYKFIRGIITPLVILAFAVAGVQFLINGTKGTESAKKIMLGAIGGLILVVFAPIIGQFLAVQFQDWGADDLANYNPL